MAALVSRPLLALVGTLFVLTAGVGSAQAETRTFLFGPADLLAAPDAFAASVLAQSATLGKQVKLSRGIVRLARNGCTSLTANPTRLLSRVRLVDGPGRAAVLASRRPNLPLGQALATMGAASWVTPGDGATRQPLWTLDPPVEEGLRTFASVGYPRGDQQGGIGAAAALLTPAPTFRADLDVPGLTGAGSAPLVLAFTTELPPAKPGRRVKKEECLLLASATPADVPALQALLDATPLAPVTYNRLNTLLGAVGTWVEKDNPVRAARANRKFVLEIARRWATEISTADAEAIVLRSLAVGEGFEF